MVLLMLTASLAGCTTSSDGVTEFDEDTMQDLIEQNLQDFINNTSVTVNNYHYTTDNSSTTQYINSSSEENNGFVMTGVMEGFSQSSDISSENDLVLLVRGDRYSSDGSGGSSNSSNPQTNNFLNGAKICVKIGSNEQNRVSSWFNHNNASYTSVPVADAAESYSKFIDGSCDAIVGLRAILEDRKSRWDSDGTMNGVDIWLSSALGQLGELYNVESRLEFEFHQEYGSQLNFGRTYFEVELTATCVSDCTSESLDEHYIFVSSLEHDAILQSYCTIPDYGLISMNDPYYMLPGLECTITLTVHAYLEHDKDNYEYTWSDWAYYISLNEYAINMEE